MVLLPKPFLSFSLVSSSFFLLLSFVPCPQGQQQSNGPPFTTFGQTIFRNGIMEPIGTIFRGGVRGTQMFGTVVGTTVNGSTGIIFNTRNREQCHMLRSSSFPCRHTHPSPSVPSSVHKLRPGDINVIAALGDSITAGTGALASSVLQIIYEYRGVAFNIGGEGNWRDYLTLPNILKEFNPRLYGYSTGVNRLTSSKPVGFNFAQTGADSDDVVKQAWKLVYKMRMDPRVDFFHDWKLVTILVGHNDICSHACSRVDFFAPVKDATPRAYMKNVAQALDILHRNLPRTFVNLMAAADISKMMEIYDKPLPCIFTHIYGCPCLFDSKLSRKLSKSKVKRILNEYLWELQGLVSSGRYDTHQGFTVVLNPILVQSDLPRKRNRRGKLQVNVDYLAPDCFHWAQKTHAMAARGVWNNLLQPVGQKLVDFQSHTPFLCPTEEFPYLATAMNSGKRKDSMQILGQDFNDMVGSEGRQQCPL